MYMNHFPEQYRVKNELGAVLLHPPLLLSDLVAAQVLGIQEDSRTGIIQALWNYIRIHGLQDKVDRRQIRADEHLRPVRILFICLLAG
jgi:SWI/SNF-related matrix-associated actin-dependent regulator of chromatin subfamily D